MESTNSDDFFMELVDRGVAALGPAVLEKLKNVAIVIDDEPSDEQRRSLNLAPGETIFGLYEGVPQTERSIEAGYELPDKITIFKEPIITTYATEADIAACVANTVWHEVAHHFGMDEELVEYEERRRNKTT